MEDENKIIGGAKQESLKIKEADNVPLNPKMRIKEIMGLPLKQKELFIPSVGDRMEIGPFVFRVSVTNPSQLRFTATLVDVNIEKKHEGDTIKRDMKTSDIKVVSK